MKLTKLQRWPKTHERNLNMAIERLYGRSFSSIGRENNISGNRVAQIYRCFYKSLYLQVFGDLLYHVAVDDKNFYKHPDMGKVFLTYQKQFFGNEKK